MTAAGSAGQDTASPAGDGQRHERGIEVEEILPGHLDYMEGRGRAFHVWTVSRGGAGNKFGLGRLSEAQLRELGRQIGHLLGPPSAGAAGGQRPGRLPGLTAGADAGD
jgi:hypothetical protein